MKRMLTFSLALLLAFALVACGKTELPVVSDEPAPYNGLKNTETGAVISLGMTQDEVEALLGEGGALNRIVSVEGGQEGEEEEVPFPEDYPIKIFSYGEGADSILIFYYNRSVRTIWINSAFAAADAPSNWCDQYGIAVGSAAGAVLKHYGEGTKLPTDSENEAISVREYDLADPLKIEETLLHWSPLFTFHLDESADCVLSIEIRSSNMIRNGIPGDPS